MSSTFYDDFSHIDFSYPSLPLRPEESKIHLLQVRPADPKAEIQSFDLVNNSLEDWPNYIDLSYTWGDPNLREIMYLNKNFTNN